MQFNAHVAQGLSQGIPPTHTTCSKCPYSESKVMDNGVIVEILYCVLTLSTGMLHYFVSCDKEIVLIKNKPKLKTHPGLPFSLHSSAGISSA